MCVSIIECGSGTTKKWTILSQYHDWAQKRNYKQKKNKKKQQQKLKSVLSEQF